MIMNSGQMRGTMRSYYMDHYQPTTSQGVVKAMASGFPSPDNFDDELQTYSASASSSASSSHNFINEFNIFTSQINSKNLPITLRFIL
jgi:hypothetical protein